MSTQRVRRPRGAAIGFTWGLGALALLGVLIMPAAAQESGARARCGSPAPQMYGRLPARPSGPALGVVPADGRPARWDPLTRLGTELYWPLEECCATLGMTLLWDPALLRGELQLDTLAWRFVIGGEVMHCGERAFQMQGPMLYADNRLLLPVSGLDHLTAGYLSGRYEFDRDSLLLVQRPPGPVATDLRIQQVSGRTYLRWTLHAEPVARFTSDGVGTLIVDLAGVFLDPRDPPRVEPRSGACLQAVEAQADGSRYVFRIASGMLGWRGQWREDRGEYQVVLTTRRDDMGRWQGYHPWPGAGPGGASSDSRRIVLVLPPEEDAGGETSASLAAARAFTALLGERVGTKLEAAGFDVTYLSAGAPRRGHGWVPAANASRALLALDLRPALCSDSLCLGLRIVTAASGELQRPLSSLDVLTAEYESLQRTRGESGGAGDIRETPAALRAWSQAVLQHGPESDEFAWILGAHLRAHGFAKLAGTPPPIVHRRWPAASLEGLDLPGAILYVGRLSRTADFPGESDWATLEPVAEATALAVEAFAYRREEGR
jgi:hypothetical protein